MAEGERDAADVVAIREMETDDTSAVLHQGEALFASEGRLFLYQTWDPYEVMGYFNSGPESCLVAEADGRIVGFVLGPAAGVHAPADVPTPSGWLAKVLPPRRVGRASSRSPGESPRAAG